MSFLSRLVRKPHASRGREPSESFEQVMSKEERILGMTGNASFNDARARGILDDLTESGLADLIAKVQAIPAREGRAFKSELEFLDARGFGLREANWSSGRIASLRFLLAYRPDGQGMADEPRPLGSLAVLLSANGLVEAEAVSGDKKPVTVAYASYEEAARDLPGLLARLPLARAHQEDLRGDAIIPEEGPRVGWTKLQADLKGEPAPGPR